MRTGRSRSTMGTLIGSRNKGCWRASIFLLCTTDRVVPARPAALGPRGAALSRPRGSCWAGSRLPEVARPSSGAVAGWEEASPEACCFGAHKQCSRGVVWASVETAVPQRPSTWRLMQVPGGVLWRPWCFFRANDRGQGSLYGLFYIPGSDEHGPRF